MTEQTRPTRQLPQSVAEAIRRFPSHSGRTPRYAKEEHFAWVYAEDARKCAASAEKLAVADNPVIGAASAARSAASAADYAEKSRNAAMNAWLTWPEGEEATDAPVAARRAEEAAQRAAQAASRAYSRAAQWWAARERAERAGEE